MAKKVIVGGRIESKEVGGIVTGAAEILDDAKGKKQNVINQETDAELVRLDQSKQDNLTFDNVPTEGSDNPVKSGGLYTAQQAILLAIAAINELIPSAASVLNQLADTAFVNSSISTNTATFRGTSAAGLNEQQFLAWANGLEHDLNDYVFWQTSDEAGNTLFKRYKWNGTEWAYEYTLNNSTFTAEQWEAIQSGITALLVAKLRALPTAQELIQSFNGKQDVLTFDDTPTLGSSNPVKSSGIYNVIKAITDLVPAEATAQNQLADKADVAAKILAAIPSWKGQFDALTDLQAVTGAKAGDMGCVKTTDSDGHAVLTFYQYNAQGAWVVYYTLRHYAQNKPATTGMTGDYPYNGMGRIELQKNIVNGVNTLTQAMLNQQNTIYVIQYDFTLDEDIAVPANCILQFDGGSISGNSSEKEIITGNNTLICGVYSFNNIKFNGTFINKELYISNNFGLNVDFFGILKSFTNAKITLGRDITVEDIYDIQIPSLKIDGKGHTVSVKYINLSNTADIKLENVVFNCENSTFKANITGTREGGFIFIKGNNSNLIDINNCTFNNVDIPLLYLRSVYDIKISNCKFIGKSLFTGEHDEAIFVYYNDKKVVINNNYFYGVSQAIRGLDFSESVNKLNNVLIADNYIEHVNDCGIHFDGGLLTNAVIRNNTIKDANCNNDRDGSGGDGSALNVHGYKNLVITGNYIESTYANFDIDGKDGKTFNRGLGSVISENTIKTSSLSIVNGKDTVFKDNNVDSAGVLQVIGSNFVITGNRLKQNNIRVYGTIPVSINIFGNTIQPGNYVWLVLNRELVNSSVVLGKNEIINVLNESIVYSDATGSTIKFTDDVITKRCVTIPVGKVTRTLIFESGFAKYPNCELKGVSAVCDTNIGSTTFKIGRISKDGGTFRVDDEKSGEYWSVSNTIANMGNTDNDQVFSNLNIRPSKNYSSKYYLYCNGGPNNTLTGNILVSLEINQYYTSYR